MKGRDLSFLLGEGAVELLDRSLEDYRTLLRSAGEVREEELRSVDYAVRHEVVRLLVRKSSIEELEATYDTLRGLVPNTRENEWSHWKSRWHSFSDLVETLAAIRSNQRPDDVQKLEYASKILELVEDQDRLTEADIAERLRIDRVSVVRTLRVLEAHDLIERHTIGRQRQVFRVPAEQYRPTAKRRFPFANEAM